jgi:hypothetical protein
MKIGELSAIRCGSNNMLKHEAYERICADASVGQAAPQELAELERHAEDCIVCRRAYAQCLDMAARQFASAGRDPTLKPHAVEESLNSDLITQRFFERAERAGIVFSREVEEEVKHLAPRPLPARAQVWWPLAQRAMAACLVAAVLVSGTHFYLKSRPSLDVAHADKQSNTADAKSTQFATLEHQLGLLNDVNRRMRSEIQALNIDLRNKNEQLGGTSAELKTVAGAGDQLRSERDAAQARLQQLQTDLADSQAVAAGMQQEMALLRNRADDLAASLVADQTRLTEIDGELKAKSEALDREQQLLAAGRDVRELMGARNLHIVDVYDTDMKGNNRRAFGRVFYTEGKSLLFYAFDLSKGSPTDAKQSFQAWGEHFGNGQEAVNLGIFFVDDKTQKRWTLKVDDPAVLAQIDSVFVTVEQPGGGKKPSSHRLLYAYLSSSANHP